MKGWQYPVLTIRDRFTADTTGKRGAGHQLTAHGSSKAIRAPKPIGYLPAEALTAIRVSGDGVKPHT